MIDDSESAAKKAWDFREYWENSAALCSSIMVYNTGRSIGQLTGLLEHRQECMVTPDAIITAVGTKIFLLNRRITRKTAHREAWCALCLLLLHAHLGPSVLKGKTRVAVQGGGSWLEQAARRGLELEGRPRGGLEVHWRPSPLA